MISVHKSVAHPWQCDIMGHMTTRFYGAQRSGDTQSWMHGANFTRDGENQGIDMSGGWHDCGQHDWPATARAYWALALAEQAGIVRAGTGDGALAGHGVGDRDAEFLREVRHGARRRGARVG